MKNIVKILYIFLFACTTLCIHASEKKVILSLSPEQVTYCKKIKAQALAETGNEVQAQKVYKSTWNKIYQTSNEYRAHRKIYFKTYKKNQLDDNNHVSKSIKKTIKHFDKQSKKSSCIQLISDHKNLNQSASVEISLDKKNQSLKLLQNITVEESKIIHENLRSQEDSKLYNLDDNYDVLDQAIDYCMNYMPEEKISPVYDFDTCFNPEIYNDELSIETHE